MEGHPSGVQVIPKIAHFHWTATPMSWLRMASIATFKRHNPGWEIRLHDTPEDIRRHGLLPAQEGDWTRWRVLEEFGGFSVGSDIVFVKPIPEEWLDCGLNACTNSDSGVYTTGIYQMAMIGAVSGHSFISEALARCETMMDVRVSHNFKDPETGMMGYQDFGPNLLQAMGRSTLGLHGKFLDQPMDALCHVRHTQCEILWEHGESALYEAEIILSSSAIGIHWYGGHERSKLEEPNAGPGGEPYIVRLAAKEWT